MGLETQKIIKNINKLGFTLQFNAYHGGDIIGWIFTQPDASGMSAAVLDPPSETNSDLNELLEILFKRLNKHIKEQGND